VVVSLPWCHCRGVTAVESLPWCHCRGVNAVVSLPWWRRGHGGVAPRPWWGGTAAVWVVVVLVLNILCDLFGCFISILVLSSISMSLM
jgi:hypothetical protein